MQFKKDKGVDLTDTTKFVTIGCWETADGTPKKDKHLNINLDILPNKRAFIIRSLSVLANGIVPNSKYKFEFNDVANEDGSTSKKLAISKKDVSGSYVPSLTEDADTLISEVFLKDNSGADKIFYSEPSMRKVENELAALLIATFSITQGKSFTTNFFRAVQDRNDDVSGPAFRAMRNKYGFNFSYQQRSPGTEGPGAIIHYQGGSDGGISAERVKAVFDEVTEKAISLYSKYNDPDTVNILKEIKDAVKKGDVTKLTNIDNALNEESIDEIKTVDVTRNYRQNIATVKTSNGTTEALASVVVGGRQYDANKIDVITNKNLSLKNEYGRTVHYLVETQDILEEQTDGTFKLKSKFKENLSNGNKIKINGNDIIKFPNGSLICVDGLRVGQSFIAQEPRDKKYQDLKYGTYTVIDEDGRVISVRGYLEKDPKTAAKKGPMCMFASIRADGKEYVIKNGGDEEDQSARQVLAAFNRAYKNGCESRIDKLPVLGRDILNQPGDEVVNRMKKVKERQKRKNAKDTYPDEKKKEIEQLEKKDKELEEKRKKLEAQMSQEYDRVVNGEQDEEQNAEDLKQKMIKIDAQISSRKDTIIKNSLSEFQKKLKKYKVFDRDAELTLLDKILDAIRRIFNLTTVEQKAIERINAENLDIDRENKNLLQRYKNLKYSAAIQLNNLISENGIPLSENDLKALNNALERDKIGLKLSELLTTYQNSDYLNSLDNTRTTTNSRRM